MVLSNVIVDVTIPRRSFVLCTFEMTPGFKPFTICVQSVSKVSAGFTSVSSLTIAAFDLVYCLYTVIVY